MFRCYWCIVFYCWPAWQLVLYVTDCMLLLHLTQQKHQLLLLVVGETQAKYSRRSVKGRRHAADGRHLIHPSFSLDSTMHWPRNVLLFSERRLTFTFAICYRPSVCRLSSVCLSSVTFVRPTQAVQIFGNISTALGTLAIRGHSLKISRRSSPENPFAGGVKHRRGSQV